uniref:Uncharacterized protein n=1 Tax=Anser cygnoides TaxID=8845 RepID=A0A8B9ER59_ANSCY
MAARGGERERPDPVQLDRLLGERVRKELRCLRLRTEHGLNPLRRGEAAGSHGHQEAYVLARQYRRACRW